MNAIALKFLPEQDNAPVVIASGVGHLGNKIHEIAKQSRVPVVKDEFLATALQNVPIDQEIPEELYKAVAVIFSFFFKIENELK